MHRTAAFLVLVAACATPRTNPATRSSAAFDPARSDAAALAVADAGTAALGGQDRWAALEELRFELRYRQGGELAGWFQQRWDRWNGRAQFVMADAKSFAADPGKVQWLEVRYDLFNGDKLPFAQFEGRPIDDESTQRYTAFARQRFADTELFTLVHRLRDPGVHLADRGEVDEFSGAADLCKPSCRMIEVTYDAGAGEGTWLIAYNAASHRPQVIAKQVADGKIAYRIDGWTEVGGLAWPSKLTNVAMPTESYEFSGVAVGKPQDAYYEPPIDRPDPAGMSKAKGPFPPFTTVGSDITRKAGDTLGPVQPPPTGG